MDMKAKMKSVLRPSRRRVSALAAVAGVAALGLASVMPASAVTAEPAGRGAKPTVVLVHGAFADSSSWNGVITRLRRAGYPVEAPANPLRGVASDSGYLESYLRSVKGPIVLVGHSYGGSVISDAAAGNSQVKALVYVAAFVPDKGETLAELGDRFPGATLPSVLDAVPYPLPGGGTGTDLYVQKGKFHDAFAADVPRSVTDLMAVTQRPLAASVFDEKTTKTAWKTIPSWDLVTTEDHAIAPAEQRFMAERAHAHTVEVDSSHAVAVSHPGAVTRLIEQAVRATSE
ncbi:alpha/beta hydrolase [Streptomyces sp. TG1A-8]|uniref:alpha/beta fold hydrolase n=1 Tax=Streptomyces sp. TG1A-8 TaxID=3051385 RepID=UPI00265C0EEB|nr:alpha/beta hydrolase [Streptomyces sp. TG1A-8]MDO0924035.1 alpha/beta hydrolase [Streptomyces sp. TG1A-8]MDO0924085.1 alpha/beta hydrolase [Streptomyces sp. TG1A-8]